MLKPDLFGRSRHSLSFKWWCTIPHEDTMVLVWRSRILADTNADVDGKVLTCHAFVSLCFVSLYSSLLMYTNRLFWLSSQRSITSRVSPVNHNGLTSFSLSLSLSLCLSLSFSVSVSASLSLSLSSRSLRLLLLFVNVPSLMC